MIRALAFCLLASAPLAAQPTIPPPPITLRSILEAPGGPVKVLEWEAGRIDESSTSDTTNSGRPFALIHAQRIQLNGAPIHGIRISLYGLAPEDHKRTHAEVFESEIGEEEVASLLQSIHDAEELQPLNDPHQHARVYVQWQSEDGLVFNAESTRSGGAVVFSLSTLREGGPAMTLTRTQMQSFFSIIRAAMNDSPSR